jgi:methylated-DNA-protein-cysteine methyltransferase related protein
VRERFFADVYALVRRVPFGRVTTYGAIALALGSPYGARQVGWAMAALEDDDVPAHRVVNAAGGLRGSRLGVELRRAMLAEEGIEFDAAGRVRMDRFFWAPSD